MKAFITGISGFSGRYLQLYLKSRRVSVFGLTGNLRDKNNVSKQLQAAKPDWIFHLASPVLRSDALIDEVLIKNLEVDLFGTVNLIEAAATLKKKPKLLITNTAAIYAPSAKPIKETDELKPQTSYGLSKLTQELVSRQLCAAYKLPLIMTRTFLLIGPGQKTGFVATDIAKMIASGAKTITLGNLNIKRDFTDVRDAVSAYYLLMQKGKPGEVYNVCSQAIISINDICQRLITLSGRQISLKTKTNWRLNDPAIVCGNNAQLTRLGWQPKITLDQSLKDTLNYWKKNV